MKTDHPGSSLTSEEAVEAMEGDLVQLTPQNFAKLSGKVELTENRLKTAQNRFLLHRNYSRKFNWSDVRL